MSNETDLEFFTRLERERESDSRAIIMRYLKAKSGQLTDEEIDLQHKVMMRAKQNVLTHIVEQDYKHKIFEGKAHDLPVDLPIQSAIDNQLNLYCDKSKVVFLTINPAPGVTFDRLKEVVKVITERTFIKEYFYVYEIRKSPDEGLHVHMVYRYDCRPFDMEKSIKKACVGIVGDIKNHHQLNIKYLKPELTNDKIQYMLGDKKKSKMAGVDSTRSWRLANGVQPYYESEPSLSCRATNIPKIELLKECNV